MFELNESPIRKNIKSLDNEQLSIFEDSSFSNIDEKHRTNIQVRTILKDIENMLQIMDKNIDKTVKIAVMGEVKAGKSTFINVCTGKQIAYTDVLEATSIVSEISYSKDEYARVYNQDGSVAKEFSFDELLEWTETMLDEMEDFTCFSKIEIGVNNELFKKLILVDTPGLFSITSENHDITNKYIAETDYIMWVLDSSNLGSKTVNDYIDKIKLSGKPIIGIINKVDSEDILLEIKDYVMKEYSNYFEEIFFVSSSNAWEMYQDGIDNWDRITGFDAIIDCIEDLAEGKEHSVSNTIYYQLQRERDTHLICQSIVNARKKIYDNELACFAKINSEIKKGIKEELKAWCTYKLYIDEKKELMSAEGEYFDNLLMKYSDSGYITNLIEDKYNEISNLIHEKWGMVENGLTMNSSEVFIDFNFEKNMDVNTIDSDILEKGATDGLKKGAMLGVAFAGFSAWLGPAAATITFAEVLLPYVIPMAVGGAFIGGMRKSNETVVNAEKNAKKKQELVESLYQDILKTVSVEMNKNRQSLYASTDYYCDRKCKQYKDKITALNFDFSESEYSSFCFELQNYISKLDDAISYYDNNDIPIPPSME